MLPMLLVGSNVEFYLLGVVVVFYKVNCLIVCINQLMCNELLSHFIDFLI